MTTLLRRSTRPKKIPKRFDNFVILSTVCGKSNINDMKIEVKDITVPQNYAEACQI